MNRITPLVEGLHIEDIARKITGEIESYRLAMQDAD